jgi:hypothetical protein
MVNVANASARPQQMGETFGLSGRPITIPRAPGALTTLHLALDRASPASPGLGRPPARQFGSSGASRTALAELIASQPTALTQPRRANTLRALTNTARAKGLAADEQTAQSIGLCALAERD